MKTVLYETGSETPLCDWVRIRSHPKRFLWWRNGKVEGTDRIFAPVADHLEQGENDVVDAAWERRSDPRRARCREGPHADRGHGFA